MPFKDPEKRKAHRKERYQREREEAYASVVQWRKENRERRNKTERIHNAVRVRTDPEFREYRRIKSRESYDKYQKKRLELARKHRTTKQARARKKAANALLRGKIIKPKHCEKCFQPTKKLFKHHADYSKPLDVIFLCALCHGVERQKD
jgi:hypothetical protein